MVDSCARIGCPCPTFHVEYHEDCKSLVCYKCRYTTLRNGLTGCLHCAAIDKPDLVPTRITKLLSSPAADPGPVSDCNLLEVCVWLSLCLSPLLELTLSFSHVLALARLLVYVCFNCEAMM